MTPTLETRRLTLRPIAITDAPSIQQYFNNWNVIRSMGPAVPWPYPIDGAQTFLKTSALPRVEKGQAHIWAITLKGSSELIGIMEFRLEPNEEGHRGFWLAEPFWGQGLMTEAVFAINDYVFDTLGYDMFIETCKATNEPSRALKRKSGGVHVDTVDKIAPAGGIEKSEIWHITRQVWQSVRS